MQKITLDFETYYSKDLNLKKKSLTTMDYVRHDMFKVWGVGIKVEDGDTEWYSSNNDEVQNALEEIDWDDAMLICHNTPFDAYILAQRYNLTPKYYADTAAMTRALHTGKSASLKETAIRCFPDDETMRKGEELESAKGVYDLDNNLDKVIGSYCIQDVELTKAIYDNMMLTMPQSEMDVIDLTCRMFCEPKLTVDREALIKFRDEEIAKAESTILASGIDKKVLSSNKQFAEHLSKIGLVPPVKRNKTGKMIPALSQNDKAFIQMQRMYPQFQSIWDARKAVKSRINETRAQNFLNATHDDGTIPVPLRYYGAHTGRWTGIEGLNMQNMPRNSVLRTSLQAPKNSLVYVADFSQIEARMTAWLADEQSLLDQFKKGEDVYSIFASKMYGKPINKHDNPTERFVGKVAVLGLGYGMGASRFQDSLETGGVKVNETEALNAVSTYRNLYNNITMLWKKLEIKTASTINFSYSENWRCLEFKNKSIWLPNGLALRYNNLRYENHKLSYDGRGKKPETTFGGKLTENVVQALARIVMSDAMVRIQNDSDINAKIVLTVHDEIVVVAPDTNPDDTMARLIKHMCVNPSWCPDLPLDAEGGYALEYSK
jgi:DNA polymerase